MNAPKVLSSLFLLQLAYSLVSSLLAFWGAPHRGILVAHTQGSWGGWLPLAKH